MRGRMRWGHSNVELPVQKEETAIPQAGGRANEVLSHVPSWGSKEAPPVVFADLGYGVLDSAMVEVAAYCLQKDQEMAA